MSAEHERLRATIAAARLDLELFQDGCFKRLLALLGQAFEAEEAGDRPRAQILLNGALDVEFELFGECELLGDLADEWGVDDETPKFQRY